MTTLLFSVCDVVVVVVVMCRCYLTPTQSLHLTKSGTTKDLGGALGIMVYVFNGSEQMDLKIRTRTHWFLFFVFLS